MVYWGKSCPVNYTCCSHAAVHPEVCELLIEKKQRRSCLSTSATLTCGLLDMPKFVLAVNQTFSR